MRPAEVPEDSLEELGTIAGRTLTKGWSFLKDSEEVFVYSEEWKEALRVQRIRLGLKERGIDPEILERTLEDYKGEDKAGNLPQLKRFLEDFDTKFHRAHLYLWSSWNGTQKSTTAKVIAKELALRGKSVWFITMGELTNSLKNQDFDEADHALIDELLKVDFLVVDDAFDTRKVTIYKSKFQLSFLDAFFRERLEVLCKSTCFTSNYQVTDIGEVFGVSLQALILRSTRPFEFVDKVNGTLNVDALWS